MAAASLVVLGIGSWSAPAERPLATSEERVAPLLEAQVQRREDERGAVDWNSIVNQFNARGIEVRPPAPPALTRDVGSRFSHPAFALPVSSRFAVTHHTALGAFTQFMLPAAGGDWSPALVAAVHPVSGLVLLQAAADLPGAAALSLAAPATGESLVAVGAIGGQRVMVPVAITAALGDHYRITPGEGAVPIGMPLFTSTGDAVAIYSGEGIAWRLRDVLSQLTRDHMSGVMPASIGITLQASTGPLAEAIGSQGAIVASTVPGGPAATAGIAAGDLLVSIGDAAVDGNTAPAELMRLPVGEPVRIVARRNRRTMTFTVTPRPWTLVAAAARRDSSALLAMQLFDARELAAAAVPGDAEVLTINMRPVRSLAEARRLLSAKPPAVVQFELDHARFFAVIGAAR